MKLPDRYKWLTEIGTLPVIVKNGIGFLGMKEIPGIKHNATIMQMAKALGVEKIYTNDEMAWCGLFVGYLLKISDKPLPDTGGDLYNYIRAAWYMNYGNAVAFGDERLGDVAVFMRPGGNHVGIIIAETTDNFVVLGGNQSNAVTITEISKERLKGCRRYYKNGMPVSAKKYIVSSAGIVSTNEK